MRRNSGRTTVRDDPITKLSSNLPSLPILWLDNQSSSRPESSTGIPWFWPWGKDTHSYQILLRGLRYGGLLDFIIQLEMLMDRTKIFEELMQVMQTVEEYGGWNSFKLYNDSLCGIRLPPPVETTTNVMILRFRTDGSVAHRGFRARFTTDLPNRKIPIDWQHPSLTLLTIPDQYCPSLFSSMWWADCWGFWSGHFPYEQNWNTEWNEHSHVFLETCWRRRQCHHDYHHSGLEGTTMGRWKRSRLSNGLPPGGPRKPIILLEEILREAIQSQTLHSREFLWN